jgi:hypothetical protein
MWSQNRDDCGLRRLVLWVATTRGFQKGVDEPLPHDAIVVDEA